MYVIKILDYKVRWIRQGADYRGSAVSALLQY